MLDGFQYVLGQIGVVLVITALLAAALGWFLGRGSRRRTEEALERRTTAIARPEADASAFAPPASVGDGRMEAAPEPGVLGDVEFPTHRLPFGVAPIDHVPLRGADDADGTVIRPEPGGDEEGTVLRPAPHTTVIRPGQDVTVIRPPQEGTVIRPPQEGTVIRPAPSGTVIRPPAEATVLRPASSGTVIRPPAETTVLRPATEGTVIRSVPGVSQPPADAVDLPIVSEAASLRPDLRDPDLQIGRIEAAALAAWDRTVPLLEQQIQDLATQNDDLRLRLRDLQDRLDTDSTSRLRAVTGDPRSEERRARA